MLWRKNKMLWRKWYVIYENGRVSRIAMSKKGAIIHANCWNGVKIFSVIKIFGKEYHHVENVKRPEPLRLPRPGLDDKEQS